MLYTTHPSHPNERPRLGFPQGASFSVLKAAATGFGTAGPEKMWQLIQCLNYYSKNCWPIFLTTILSMTIVNYLLLKTLKSQMPKHSIPKKLSIFARPQHIARKLGRTPSSPAAQQAILHLTEAAILERLQLRPTAGWEGFPFLEWLFLTFYDVMWCFFLCFEWLPKWETKKCHNDVPPDPTVKPTSCLLLVSWCALSGRRMATSNVWSWCTEIIMAWYSWETKCSNSF